MSLGENIYRLRTGKKLSQGDLADALDVSRQSVSKWENNSAVPELEKLVKMAKLFGISLDDLVGNAPPESVPAPESIPAPEPAPSPAAAPGLTTGDLISVVLLIFAVIVPILLLITAELHNNVWLLFISLFVFPVLVPFAASKCSPNNKLLRNAYMIYNVLMAIVISIVCLGAPALDLLLTCLYFLPIFFWPSDSP